MVVVGLDYDRCVKKMLPVLGDGEKFLQLGIDFTHDKTETGISETLTQVS